MSEIERRRVDWGDQLRQRESGLKGILKSGLELKSLRQESSSTKFEIMNEESRVQELSTLYTSLGCDVGGVGCGTERDGQEYIPTRAEMEDWHSDEVIGWVGT